MRSGILHKKEVFWWQDSKQNVDGNLWKELIFFEQTWYFFYQKIKNLGSLGDKFEIFDQNSKTMGSWWQSKILRGL